MINDQTENAETHSRQREQENTEDKWAEESLQERLHFEQLLSDHSARFVNIAPDQVDVEIRSALRQVLELFSVDRCGLIRVSPNDNTFRITHVAYASDIPPVPENTDLSSNLFPWVYEKIIKRHEVVSFTTRDELPSEAAVDKQTYEGLEIRSALNIPLPLGAALDYIISINTVRKKRVFPEEYIPRLRLLGEVLVNTLQLARTRQQLEDRLRFEGLISDLSVGFVSISSEEVESEINKWLQRITEFFGADRCTLGLFSEDGAQLRRAFEYHLAGVEPGPVSLSKDQLPWYVSQLMQGKLVVINRLEDLPADAEAERRLCLAKSMKSILSIPVISGRRTLGSCVLVSVRAERIWPADLVQRMRLIAAVFAGALARKQMEDQLRVRLKEIEGLKQELQKENIYLREEIELQNVHEEIVGRSQAMKVILAQVEQVARTDATVLIQGETGTGKELLARAVHRLSVRKDRPLVTVNCASLPPTLIESELFGREKGAYTGALTRMTGRFEVADRATMFLDEIGEMPQDVQAKLLRVLEEGRFERLGSTISLQVNVRIIAATNRDLARDVAEGKFRQDLYYRLNVFPIAVPPLRERPEDVPLLVWAFVRQYEKKMGKRIDHIPRKRMEDLQHYLWPGNARELRNVVEHAMIVSSGKTLEVHVPRTASSEIPASLSLADANRRHILNVLQKSNWRLTGRGGAAEILRLKRTTLQSKMKKLSIRRPGK
jgi:transcriptional regulator with GAF, ATPase, and Fis domain